jgi:FKBP-type peptidyl-prolyl cis-trans isomerase FkpA
MRFKLIGTLALSAIVAGCTPTEPAGPSDPTTDTYAVSLGVDIASMTRVRPDADVYYKDVVVGTGTAAAANKPLVLAYTGYLTNGTSFGTGTTSACLVNDANYIAGWVIGITQASGMKVGTKRKLVIGSLQGYGSQAKDKIPANSTLVFDVELKEVRTTQDPSCG